MKHRSTFRSTFRSRLALAALAGWAIALAGTSMTWAGTPAAPPVGFKVFGSALGGYQMAYPATWSAKGASLIAVFRGPTVQGVPTMVDVNPLGTAATFGSADALAGMIVRSHHKDGTTVLSQTKMRVAGNDARVINEQQKSLGVLEHVSVVVFLGHNTAWMISYSAASAQYARTLSAFRTMLSSFTFVK